jgi:hypothetical protein
MVRVNKLSVVLGVVASGVFVLAARGDQWYPFYGYNRPSYAGQSGSYGSCPAQSSPQTYTTNYPPAQDSATPTQPPCAAKAPAPAARAATRTVQCRGVQWYPFYGYGQPGYVIEPAYVMR